MSELGGSRWDTGRQAEEEGLMGTDFLPLISQPLQGFLKTQRMDVSSKKSSPVNSIHSPSLLHSLPLFHSVSGDCLVL